jgi:hypothetical protein
VRNVFFIINEEEKMEELEAEKEICPWYKCRNDLKVVAGIHLALAIFLIVAGYDRIGRWSQQFVHLLFLKSLFPIFVYIEWSMWPYAIAIIIIALFLCLGHYWKWIIVSWSSLSMIGAYSIGTYGFRNITLSWLVQGTASLALIHLPVFVCLSGIIYLIRKKNRERMEKI